MSSVAMINSHGTLKLFNYSFFVTTCVDPNDIEIVIEGIEHGWWEGGTVIGAPPVCHPLKV